MIRRCQRSISRRRIHLDPVIPHPRLDLLSIYVRDDQVRFLHRHVAINAVVANPRAQLRKLPAVAVFVARQAFVRISRRRSFGRVHFMARRAAHLRILVAAAPLRQRHLVAVNIHRGVGIGTLQPNVVLQRLSRNVRECRLNRLPDSSVALRADSPPAGPATVPPDSRSNDRRAKPQ